MPMSEEVARQKVKRPLSPVVLEEIQALNEFPDPVPGFDPGGEWRHTYRIWLNHGFYGQLNLDAGLLRIGRRPTGSGDRFELTIEQRKLNWEGIVNTITARIECENNPVSSPVSWTYESRFTDTAGNDRPELGARRTARREGASLVITINDSSKTESIGSTITGDWCLFDAVQRLAFDSTVSLDFDVYEGLTVLKRNQRLKYRPDHKYSFKRINLPLHNFYQLGEGVLPYEYWLDDNHRLLMAISGDRLYILDNDAETTFNAEVIRHRKGEYSWKNKL